MFSDSPTQIPPFAEIEALATNLEKGTERGGVSLPNVLGGCRTRNPGKRILLIADQFEEVFTFVENEAVQRRFIDVLLSGFSPRDDRNPPWVCLILTLRADFYGAALRHRPLADALQGHVENLGPMSRDELREAIVKPAGAVRFESGLIETFLDEVTSRPGSLPLMQFALREMWSMQQGRCIAREAYDSIGGVQGALARRAQTIFDTQTGWGRNSQAVRLFQRLFLRMVTLGEGAQDTRRVVRRQELGEEAWSLAQRLADEDNRLVVTSAPVSALDERTGERVREETAEVMHEALIRNWPTLTDWITRDRAFLSWLRQLKPRVDEWRSDPGDRDTLLRGTPLAVAEDWLARRQDEFSDEEKAYIRAGITFREAERQKEEEGRQAELRRQQQLAEAAQRLAEEQRLRAETAHQLAAAQMRARKAQTRRFFWMSAVGLVALFLGSIIWQRGEDANRAKARSIDLKNKYAIHAPEGNFRRSLLLAIENLDATERPDDFYDRMTGSDQRIHAKSLTEFRKILSRAPWFGGRYRAAGLDPAGDRMALLTQDQRSLLVLTLPADGGETAEPELKSYELPDQPAQALTLRPAAGFISGLGPAALVNGYVYFWSERGEREECNIGPGLPASGSWLPASGSWMRAEYVAGQLQISTTERHDLKSSLWVLGLEASHLRACATISAAEALQVPERGLAQPVPVFSEAPNLPHFYAYLEEPSKAVPNELGANLPVDPSRTEAGNLLELDAVVSLTDREGQPAHIAVGQVSPERGIPERLRYTIASAVNAEAILFKFDGPDFYVYDLANGRPSNPPGSLYITPQHVSVATNLPPYAWRLQPSRIPWVYPPFAAAKIDQHWWAAWLAANGVWAVESSDRDPGTAAPILDTPLIGEPDGAKLQFTGDGQFLVLQRVQLQSPVSIRIWDLRPSWRRWIENPKTTESELRRIACRIVRMDGTGGAFDETETELFQIDAARREPCPEPIGAGDKQVSD